MDHVYRINDSGVKVNETSEAMRSPLDLVFPQIFTDSLHGPDKHTT